MTQELSLGIAKPVVPRSPVHRADMLLLLEVEIFQACVWNVLSRGLQLPQVLAALRRYPSRRRSRSRTTSGALALVSTRTHTSCVTIDVCHVAALVQGNLLLAGIPLTARRATCWPSHCGISSVWSSRITQSPSHGWSAYFQRPSVSVDRLIANLVAGRGVVDGFVRHLLLVEDCMASVRMRRALGVAPIILWISQGHATMKKLSHLGVELAGGLVGELVLVMSCPQ